MNGNETVKKIQKFAKAIGVIAKITFIACLVGLCMNAVAIVWLAVTGSLETAFSTGSLTYRAPISAGAFAGMTLAEQFGYLAYVTAVLGFSASIARRCIKLFRNIEHQTTPFTMENAEIFKKLGIITIVAAIVPVIVGESVGMSVAVTAGVAFQGEYGSGFSLLTALLLFAVSVIFRYGCELQTQVDETL